MEEYSAGDSGSRQAVWDFELTMPWDAYRDWVTGELKSEFGRPRTTGDTLEFSRNGPHEIRRLLIVHRAGEEAERIRAEFNVVVD